MLAVASHCAILIVEDHADTAEMLRRVLARRGLSCQVVADGGKALDAVREYHPCCVILDEQMPGMTGLEVMRQLKAWPECAGIPVVFYSASWDWQKQMEAGALGAKGWFVKGAARIEDLANQVSRLCGGRDA